MTYSERLARKPIPNIGYTTRRHLLLDLDNTNEHYAEEIAKKIMREWNKVGDCLLVCTKDKPDKIRLRYSRFGRPLLIHDRHNFHLIFDNGIGYNLSVKICQTLAELGILNKDYVKIREFRGDMTLRIGESTLYEETKPVPRIIKIIKNHYTCRQDGYIGEYLKIKKSVERLFSSQVYAESETH